METLGDIPITALFAVNLSGERLPTCQAGRDRKINNLCNSFFCFVAFRGLELAGLSTVHPHFNYSQSHCTFRCHLVRCVNGLDRMASRVILLGMVVFIYVLSWKEKISYYLAAFLLLLTVVDFNTLLFSSYFDWVVPFLLLTVFELLLLLKERIDSQVGRIGPARNP